MTAIAGVWGVSPPLASMLDAVAGRAAGRRFERRLLPDLQIACGHPLARPGAPLEVQSGYALVLDGRLEGDDGKPLDQPAQTAIALYRAHGVGGFARLRGDFALALWDPVQHRLILARDGLGVRPLVYRCVDGVFAFASEERGLKPLYGQEPLCPLRAAEYLVGIAPPEDRGMRASVRRVVPGTAVVTDGRALETQRFDTLALKAPAMDAPAVQTAKFRELLQDAVARRCAEEPRLDCFLSGGLDSSSLVTLAAVERDDPIRTLSLINTLRPEMSEQTFVEAAIGAHRIDACFVDVGRYDPFEGAEAALVRHAGPVAAPNLLMMRPLYDRAREGSVLFDGHGGDEVVSKGTGRLLDLAQSGAWFSLFAELRGVADLYGESAWSMILALYRAFGPGRHKLAGLERVMARRFRKKTAESDLPIDLLSRDFRLSSGIDKEIESRWKPRPCTGREADFEVLTAPQQSFALEVLDREARDLGLESRFPFWDRALIDYSMSLPTEAKLQDGWTRLILRRAMSDVLPQEILWRRDKHDFSSQLREGLKASSVVSADALEAARDRLSEHLDVDKVLALRARLDHPEASVSGHSLQALWRIGLWSIWSATSDAGSSASSA